MSRPILDARLTVSWLRLFLGVTCKSWSSTNKLPVDGYLAGHLLLRMGPVQINLHNRCMNGPIELGDDSDSQVGP
jgi:hypothetical protein